MKILVADDDAVSRLLMQRTLQQKGFEVITASNGSEAVDLLLQEDGPRLVLLDWTMPELNGPEVCRAIRSGSRSAYVYITLLTSRDSKEDLVAGLEAGADDYLTKPCHPEELGARLRTGQRILQLEDILVGARDDMQFHATHDSLTQLLNRGAILETFSRSLAQARRGIGEFGLMLCDIDHFKLINDSHGHPVGDEVLREMSRRLKSCVRAEKVGRYGGEEFLLLLDGCSRKHLQLVADRICHTIRATPVQTSAGPVLVTLSAGAVHVATEGRLSAEELIQEVDSALYRAKRGGRDRAVVAMQSDLVASAYAVGSRGSMFEADRSAKIA